ncbi:zinc finger CCHC domain-containing protein 3-like [Heptranchias perlo]|uniref:zinc finger CCHC domain-containing protein 3-like n=1 Tax=Heptranchias perlo TaxID=212740 RepID=UPI00355A8031
MLAAEPLFTLPTQRNRKLIVHMYNPHVPLADVLTFLARYVDGAHNSVDVTDQFGIWTSKREVTATLRLDAHGNIVHPPSSFAIGGSRGYITYVGQPRVCRTCGKSGHLANTCTATVCKNCKQEGHQTKDCKESKRCNLCGLEGHLYRVCPERNLSYAQAAKNNTAEEEGATSKDAPKKAKSQRPAATSSESLWNLK